MTAALLLLRRFWPAIPIALLGAALLLTRAQLTDARHALDLERSHQETATERARRERAEQEAGFVTRLVAATTTYADRLASREPLIVHSTNTVREYAQTDAGRVLCRDPGRVRAIADLDATLSAATTSRSASGSAGAVPTDPAAPPAGR